MGMKSKSTTEEKLPTGTRDFRAAETAIARDASATASVPPTDSGTAAAIDRLTKAQPKSETSSGYKPRDFDAEARGKTRCVQFEAALMSPALAGAKWDSIDEFLALCRKAADAGVAYTFGE